MKFLKIAFICLALAIFVIACNQTPTTNNNAGNTTANTTANTSANNMTANNANVFSNVPVNVPQDITQSGTASGRKIFMEVCANCHKEDGTGGKVTIEGQTINAENLASAHAAKESDAELFDYIKNGVPDEGMPAFKDKLSDAEIKNVVQFIRAEIQNKKT